MFLTTAVFGRMFRPRMKRDRWWKIQKLKEQARHFRFQTIRGRVRLAIRFVRRSYIYQTQARRAKPLFRSKLRHCRLDAACGEFNLSGNRFKAGLTNSGVELSNHMLLIMAMYEPRTFERLVELSERSNIEKIYKNNIVLPDRCFTKVEKE